MPLNPRHMCDRVFEMVKEITSRIKMLKMELKSRGRETVPLEFLKSSYHMTLLLFSE